MDKRWYPAALTAALVGCGGSTDNGGTGSAPGAGGVDAGMPVLTGGMVGVYYGVAFYGPIPVGGASGLGGSTSFTPTGGQYGLGGFIAAYGPILMGGNVAIGGRSSIDG